MYSAVVDQGRVGYRAAVKMIRTAVLLGVAKKDGSEPVRADQLPFLMSFVDQAALALERINLVEQMITSSYGQHI